MKVNHVGDILEIIRSSGKKWKLCVAAPHDETTLEAVIQAHDLGIVECVLFGSRAAVDRTASSVGVDIPSGITIVETKDDNETVRECARYLWEGKADVLLKGLVPTSSLMRAIVRGDGGLPSSGFISHVAVYDEPGSGHLMLLTDAGINIAPNIQRKVQIVKNAVCVARALGIDQPRVAMLAAVEDLKYPSMPATLDAVLVSRIAASGVIPDAIVKRPFAMDNAVSEAAARTKKLESRKVAGHADILCVPEIETGNVLYKCLEIYCGVTFAGVVVGTVKPIAVASRADSSAAKLLSIALACLLAGEPCSVSS